MQVWHPILPWKHKCSVYNKWVPVIIFSHARYLCEKGLCKKNYYEDYLKRKNIWKENPS